MPSCRGVVVVSLVFLLTAGCLKDVTFRTVIKEDGAVNRYVRVEAERAPRVDSDLILPPKDGWQLYKNEKSLFEVQGQFKSVAEIPLDWQKKPQKESGILETSKSIKRYTPFRTPLFTLHEYTETIQDVATREQFDKAVEELIDYRKMLYVIADGLYGEELDFTAARAYLDEVVAPWVRRLAGAYWVLRLDKETPLAKSLPKLLAARLRELGVAVPEGADGDALGQATEQALKAWAYAKLAELVKTKAGEKLTARQVEERIKALSASEASRKRLDAATKAAQERLYGGQKAFESAMGKAVTRLAGAYLQFFKHGFRFEASVTVPGIIVKANGLIEDNTASWSFTHDEIFPYYRMHVTSVAFARANVLDDGTPLIPSPVVAVKLAEVLGPMPEADRAALLKLMDLLAQQPTAERVDAFRAKLKELNLTE